MIRLTRPLGLATLLFFGGCATFREGLLPSVDHWPPPQAAKKTVSLVLSDRYIYNGQEGGMVVIGRQLWLDHAMKVYVESGLFSHVLTGREAADRVAEIRVVQDTEESIGRAILSGLTLTLFPTRQGNTITVRTTLKDGNSGDVLGTIENKETLNTYGGLLLLFVMPFKFPTTVSFPAYEDLHKATLKEAVARGYL